MFAYIIVCGSFEGCRLYDDEASALAAAAARSALDGRPWEPRWVFIPEE